MPRRCCFVIPLRAGVAIAGLLMTVVSVALIGLSFTHKNPMVMHLNVIHPVLPWVYIVICAVSAVMGLFGVLAAVVGKHGLMKLYKLLFWILFFVLCVWQAVDFVLALINRPKSLDACEQAMPQQNNTSNATDTTFSVAGHSTTILGMQLGNAYGLATCGQAVQAGVIGLAVLLFFGGIVLFYFARVASAYTTSLNKNSGYHRQWDYIADLQADYKEDARNAPKYPLNDLSTSKSNKKFGFLKKIRRG